jgi:hypothetical protein
MSISTLLNIKMLLRTLGFHHEFYDLCVTTTVGLISNEGSLQVVVVSVYIEPIVQFGLV